MFDRNKWKILRGDTVIITTGKDAGETGTVTKVIRDDTFPRVVVEGLNLVRPHLVSLLNFSVIDSIHDGSCRISALSRRRRRIQVAWSVLSLPYHIQT